MQAGGIWGKRAKSPEQISHLMTQLQVYKTGGAPFDKGYGGSAFNLRAWWASMLDTPAAKESAELAVLLLDIRPHAADPERTFSTMGWFKSARRNRLSVQTTAMMTAIKVYNQQYKPTPRQRMWVQYLLVASAFNC